jgi:hypothetical protein
LAVRWGVDAEERPALVDEGVDPDDEQVVMAVAVVRWELSLLLGQGGWWVSSAIAEQPADEVAAAGASEIGCHTGWFTHVAGCRGLTFDVAWCRRAISGRAQFDDPVCGTAIVVGRLSSEVRQWPSRRIDERVAMSAATPMPG